MDRSEKCLTHSCEIPSVLPPSGGESLLNFLEERIEVAARGRCGRHCASLYLAWDCKSYSASIDDFVQLGQGMVTRSSLQHGLPLEEPA